MPAAEGSDRRRPCPVCCRSPPSCSGEHIIDYGTAQPIPLSPPVVQQHNTLFRPGTLQQSLKERHGLGVPGLVREGQGFVDRTEPCQGTCQLQMTGVGSHFRSACGVSNVNLARRRGFGNQPRGVRMQPSVPNSSCLCRSLQFGSARFRVASDCPGEHFLREQPDNSRKRTDGHCCQPCEMRRR